MKDDTVLGFIMFISHILIFLFGMFFVWGLSIKPNILIPEYEWKCTHAVIINDDPSKTECTVYKKNVQ
jgi:hypothetical protein